jgi:hypothetical protein
MYVLHTYNKPTTCSISQVSHYYHSVIVYPTFITRLLTQLGVMSMTHLPTDLDLYKVLSQCRCIMQTVEYLPHLSFHLTNPTVNGLMIVLNINSRYLTRYICSTLTFSMSPDAYEDVIINTLIQCAETRCNVDYEVCMPFIVQSKIASSIMCRPLSQAHVPLIVQLTDLEALTDIFTFYWYNGRLDIIEIIEGNISKKCMIHNIARDRFHELFATALGRKSLAMVNWINRI